MSALQDTTPTYEDRLDALRLEAARWVERRRVGAIAPDEQRALDAWLAESPAHALEFELAESLLGSEELRVALAEAAAEAARRPSQRAGSIAAMARGLFGSPVRALALAAALMVVGGGGVIAALHVADLNRGGAAPPTSTAHASVIATRPGEPMIATLSDGSRVELNGGTTLAVSITADRREVEMRAGDASFEIAPDASRPFTVTAGDAAATALGTIFTVTRFQESTVVSVLEGTVRVAGRDESAEAAIVDAGVRVAVEGEALSLTQFDLDGVADWRSGWLDTPSITLEDLGDLMWRRTGRRVFVSDDVAALMVSGRFRIDDPDAVLQSLARLHGLSVVTGGAGVVVRGAPRQ